MQPNGQWVQQPCGQIAYNRCTTFGALDPKPKNKNLSAPDHPALAMHLCREDVIGNIPASSKLVDTCCFCSSASLRLTSKSDAASLASVACLTDCAGFFFGLAALLLLAGALPFFCLSAFTRIMFGQSNVMLFCRLHFENSCKLSAVTVMSSLQSDACRCQFML